MKIMAAAVVTLVVGVPEEDLVGKQDDGFVAEACECLRKTWIENNVAR